MLTIDGICNAVLQIVSKYSVTKVDLFGSYATNMATANSDVDFLVQFSPPIPSIFAVMGFKEELSAALGIKVDVVTMPLTNPEKLNIKEVKNIYDKT